MTYVQCVKRIADFKQLEYNWDLFRSSPPEAGCYAPARALCRAAIGAGAKVAQVNPGAGYISVLFGSAVAGGFVHAECRADRYTFMFDPNVEDRTLNAVVFSTFTDPLLLVGTACKIAWFLSLEHKIDPREGEGG